MANDGVPKSDGDAFLNVNTLALNIYVKCVPGEITNVKQSPDGSFSYNVSLSGNEACDGSSSFSGGSNNDWAGIMYEVDAACVPSIDSTASSTDNIQALTRPVVINFASNPNATSAAYCYGYQQVYNVTATADLQWNILDAVTDTQYIPNHPLEGYVLNGSVSLYIR